MTSHSDQLRQIKLKRTKQLAAIINRTIQGAADVAIEFSPHGDWPAWSEAAKVLRPSPPYRPGLFKGSWDYSYGTPTSRVINEIDPTGDLSRNRIASGLGADYLFDLEIAAEKHFVVNNTPYGRLMESGAYLVGHNVELGHMLEMVKLSFDTVVREAIRKSRA